MCLIVPTLCTLQLWCVKFKLTLVCYQHPCRNRSFGNSVVREQCHLYRRGKIEFISWKTAKLTHDTDNISQEKEVYVKYTYLKCYYKKKLPHHVIENITIYISKSAGLAHLFYSSPNGRRAQPQILPWILTKNSQSVLTLPNIANVSFTKQHMLADNCYPSSNPLRYGHVRLQTSLPPSKNNKKTNKTKKNGHSNPQFLCDNRVLGPSPLPSRYPLNVFEFALA